MHRCQPPAETWGLGWLSLSPRGWLWGAHVSLCPLAGSALLPFKPPSKGFPVLPVSGPGLLMSSCSQPWAPARALPPAHHPSVGAAWRRAPQPQRGSPLTQGGTHCPKHPVAQSGHSAPPCHSAHSSLGLILHLPSSCSTQHFSISLCGDPAETRSPCRAPQGARPPAHPARHHMMPVPSLLRGGPQLLHWLR